MGKTNSLQKLSKNTVDKLIISDCVSGVPMITLPGKLVSDMIIKIALELDRLVIVFNWKPNPGWKLSFVDMIMDKYKLESIEDILMCLRDGRLGKYKKPFGVLDPVTFGEWMVEHLDRKYQIIEDQKKQQKPEHNDLPEFKTRQGYNEFVRIGLINQGKILKAKQDQSENEKKYRKFKANYLSKKPPKQK